MDYKRCFLAVAIVAASVVVAQPASGSQLIDRNAHNLTLEVDAKGEAMLSYTAAGKQKHVLAWGAVNAIPPNKSRAQTKFSLDYSGGFGRHHVTMYWQKAPWVCLPYDGPVLAWDVAACKAPDGSYWAVQAWQRSLPDLGVTPSALQAVWELHLSHWTGDAPVLSISVDWSYRRFAHLFGTYTWRMDRAGSERTASSPTVRKAHSVTASIRTGAGRSARARSIERQSSARVSRRM